MKVLSNLERETEFKRRVEALRELWWPEPQGGQLTTITSVTKRKFPQNSLIVGNWAAKNDA